MNKAESEFCSFLGLFAKEELYDGDSNAKL